MKVSVKIFVRYNKTSLVVVRVLSRYGVAYTRKLEEAGVNLILKEYPAMPRGFLNFQHFSPDAKPAFTV